MRARLAQLDALLKADAAVTVTVGGANGLPLLGRGVAADQWVDPRWGYTDPAFHAAFLWLLEFQLWALYSSHKGRVRFGSVGQAPTPPSTPPSATNELWDVCHACGSHEKTSRQPTRDHAKRPMFTLFTRRAAGG